LFGLVMVCQRLGMFCLYFLSTFLCLYLTNLIFALHL
jgi:hypothetical protein